VADGCQEEHSRICKDWFAEQIYKKRAHHVHETKNSNAINSDHDIRRQITMTWLLCYMSVLICSQNNIR
jgi:hypothetical protein